VARLCFPSDSSLTRFSFRRSFILDALVDWSGIGVVLRCFNDAWLGNRYFIAFYAACDFFRLGVSSSAAGVDPLTCCWPPSPLEVLGLSSGFFLPSRPVAFAIRSAEGFGVGGGWFFFVFLSIILL